VQCPQESSGSFTILSGDPFSYREFIHRENISIIRYWIFGDTSIVFNTIPVQQDQSFNFTLNGQETSRMINGNYRILFEVPTSGDTFDLKISYIGKHNDTVLYDKSGNRILNFQDVTNNNLNGLNAADIVEREIQKTGLYSVSNITLIVQEPLITINPVSDHYYLGDMIEINGTTNCDKGEIQILVHSLPFVPGCENQEPSDVLCGCCEGFGITAPIITGICGNNTWSSEINTSQHNFYPGEFGLWFDDRDCSPSDNLFPFEQLNISAVPTNPTLVY